MPGPRDDSLEEIPDLVIETPPRRAPAPAATQPMSAAFELDFGPASVHPPSLGALALSDEIELFAESADRASADLELGLELEPLGGPSAALTLSTETSDLVAAGSSRSRASANLPWPTGMTPSLEELHLDPAEARRLAGFGPPPRFFLTAPLYAIRVWSRRSALRAQKAEAERVLAALEHERDEELVHLAEMARVRLEANDRYRALIVDLERHERLLEERTATLSQSDTVLQAVALELDRELSTLRAQTDKRALEQSQAQQVVRDFEERVGRSQMQSKRHDIERRALLDVARRKLGPAGGKLPRELDAELAELDAKRHATDRELAALDEELKKARGVLGDATKDLTQTRLALARADSEKNRRLSERLREIDGHARELDVTRRARREALVGIARSVLGMKGHIPVDEELLDRLRQLDAQVAAAARNAQLHALAPLAADAAAVRRGLWLLALAVIALGASPWLWLTRS